MIRRRSASLSVALLAGLLLAATWSLSGQPAGTVLVDVVGHVEEVCQGCFALVPAEGDPGTRYKPDELAEGYRVDGLAVVFSGVVGEIPPNVRLWATPLELTAIRRRD